MKRLYQPASLAEVIHAAGAGDNPCRRAMIAGSAPFDVWRLSGDDIGDVWACHDFTVKEAPIKDLAWEAFHENGPVRSAAVVQGYLAQLAKVGRFMSLPVLRAPPWTIIDGRHRLFAAYIHAQGRDGFTVEVYGPASPATALAPNR